MTTSDQQSDRLDALNLRYSSALRCTIIQLPSGNYALFSVSGDLLACGSWESLEPAYLTRPVWTPRPSKTETRKNLTEKLLRDLDL